MGIVGGGSSLGVAIVPPVARGEVTQPVRLAYQPPASSTFLSEQISNQPTVFFSQKKSAPAISHQPNEQADRGVCDVESC
jgi:hypothetical protein